MKTTLTINRRYRKATRRVTAAIGVRFLPYPDFEVVASARKRAEYYRDMHQIRYNERRVYLRETAYGGL